MASQCEGMVNGPSSLNEKVNTWDAGLTSIDGESEGFLVARDSTSRHMPDNANDVAGVMIFASVPTAFDPHDGHATGRGGWSSL